MHYFWRIYSKFRFQFLTHSKALSFAFLFSWHNCNQKYYLLFSIGGSIFGCYFLYQNLLITGGFDMKNQNNKNKTNNNSNENIPFNVDIIKRQVNLEDNVQSLELKISNNGTTNIVTMKRSEVFNTSDKLLDYGAEIISPKDFKNIMYLRESTSPVRYIHSGLGWDKYKGEHIFKAYSTVGWKSTYKGKFDIKPAGSFEEWKNTIVEYVIPQNFLQLITILGLSSVTMGFLQDEMDGSIFVHIYGKSSKGKTTGGMAAISSAGNPNIVAKNTLFADYGDTSNYLISMLAGNHGFPIVFDELSKAQTKNLSEFVYNVCNGKDKGRLKSNSEQRETKTWCTTVLSTGESSLLARCNNNAGLLARVLEICPEEITASAEQAEALKDGIIHNYGWANTILAEFYLQHPQRISKVFNKYREILKRDIPLDNELVNRLSKKLAVILTTAHFAEIALDIDFDTKAIKKMLIEAVLKQNEEYPFEQSKLLVDCLLSDLTTNPSKYFELKQREPLNDLFGQKIRGFVREIKPISVGEEQCSVELIFPTANFEKLLKQFGFTNKLKELQSLDEKGFIKKEGKHYSIRRKIAGKKIPVYVLTLPESLLSAKFRNTVEEI